MFCCFICFIRIVWKTHFMMFHYIFFTWHSLSIYLREFPFFFSSDIWENVLFFSHVIGTWLRNISCHSFYFISYSMSNHYISSLYQIMTNLYQWKLTFYSASSYSWKLFTLCSLVKHEFSNLLRDIFYGFFVIIHSLHFVSFKCDYIQGAQFHKRIFKKEMYLSLVMNLLKKKTFHCAIKWLWAHALESCLKSSSYEPITLHSEFSPHWGLHYCSVIPE